MNADDGRVFQAYLFSTDEDEHGNVRWADADCFVDEQEQRIYLEAALVKGVVLREEERQIEVELVLNHFIPSEQFNHNLSMKGMLFMSSY